LPIARKAAVSLLICVLLFAGFCVFSFTGFFNIVETRFYNKAVLNELNNNLAADTEFIDNYLSELQQRFSDILNENAVRNSFWVNQNAEDIYERDRIFSSLGISLPELQWVRFVDDSGGRIHYSTNPDDQITTNTETILYKNYPEVADYLPFDQQLLSGINMRRIVFDGEAERLIFYYPFYDSMDIHRGEALFSISIRTFSERFVKNTQIKINEDISIISSPNGIVIGIPRMDIELIKEAVASVWAASGALTLNRIYASPSNPLVLLSSKTSQGIFIGLIVSEETFAFPNTLKVLLTASVFTTLFVIMFLIFNVKQDPVAIVQNRLKELQVSLMHEYYQLMGDMDWAVWRRELEQRRTDVKQELCRGLKIKKGGDIESYIDSFFNRSWDGLIAAIGSRTGMITTFDEAKLEAILSRVLTSAKPEYTDDFEFQPADDGKDGEIEYLQDADETLTDDSADVLDPLDDIPPCSEYDVEELEGTDDTEEIPKQEGMVDGRAHKDLAGQSAKGGSAVGISGVEKFKDSQSGTESVPLNVYSPKYLWNTVDSAGSTYEDNAWRKLAEETAAMEPSEIWEELAVKRETPEVPETVNDAGKDAGILNGDILEEDPFIWDMPPEEALGGATGGLVDIEEAGYGEFIPETAEEAAPVFSIDPLYNVEEFAEADDDFVPDDHFSAAANAPSPVGHLNTDAISPMNEIFIGGNNSAGKTPAKMREIETQKPVNPTPGSYFQFFPNDSDDLEFLETVDEEESLIKKRNGIDYIDSAALKAASVRTEKVDPRMKNLVDSVLHKN
jgi:hypothetical protein